MKFLIDKLLFRDIRSGISPRSAAHIRFAKWIALTLIAVTFAAGALLSVRHALKHYESIKAEFFAEEEPVDMRISPTPLAVWFTHETGDPRDIQGIIAYWVDFSAGQLTIDVVNVNDIPVELVSLQDKNGIFEYPITENSTLQPSENYEIYSFQFENVDERLLSSRAELVVNYNYDDDILHQAALTAFQPVDETVFQSTLIRTKDNMQSFDFIREDDQFIFFAGEEITINEPLFIPAGKALRLIPGQEIDLINQAFILARAPVLFEGTEEQPIRIWTSDQSGRGLLVMQADEKSSITHTIFDGLDAPASGVWELTGAVTFYESDVDISKGQFINNPSEDGLNIIRSEFTVQDSLFANTASDAFDADFCRGTISDSTFENTANDAIDVSGSSIEIINTTSRNNGDKGISAGENSEVNLQSVTIENAVIGIASKDFSRVTGSDVTITNSRIGVTLYIKKPEFGPAAITLTNYTIGGNIDLEFLIQPGSTLIIDGRIIRPRSAAKETLLFEKMINGEPIQ